MERTKWNNVKSMSNRRYDSMLSVLFWPMCQSGYEMWRKFDTHGLIITIGDNRDTDDAVETLDAEESEILE